MSRLSTSLRPCAHPIFPFSVLSVEAFDRGLDDSTSRRRRGKSESPPTTRGLEDGVDDGIRKASGMTKSESAAFHHSLAVRFRRPTPDWLLIPTRFLFPTVSSVEGKILASNNTSACFSKISLKSSPSLLFVKLSLNPSPLLDDCDWRFHGTPSQNPCPSPLSLLPPCPAGVYLYDPYPLPFLAGLTELVLTPAFFDFDFLWGSEFRVQINSAVALGNV